MSKRKNVMIENFNKDFCDFLMGKEYLLNRIGLRVGRFYCFEWWLNVDGFFF